MPEMISPSAAGIPVEQGIVDLNSLPVMKARPTPSADRTVDKATGEALLRSGYGLVSDGSQGALSLPAPVSYEPTAQPAALPPAQQAIPFPATQPDLLRPNDPPRFQDRINQLYGQKKEAEERAAQLEARLSDTLARLESRFQPAPQNQPYTNQYNQFPSNQPQAQTPPAADSVSRAELFAALEQQRQVLASQSALMQAHTVSRLEAERTFPEVFRNPSVKQAADEIWARDRTLQGDPRGPEKAAAQALGLFYASGSAPAPVQVPQAVRKENLSGLGPTVAEGSPQPQNQTQQRYDQAMTYAKTTGRLEDFARARRVQLGLE